MSAIIDNGVILVVARGTVATKGVKVCLVEKSENAKRWQLINARRCCEEIGIRRSKYR